jgi:hypothetical protein
MSLGPLLGPDEMVERLPAGWNELDVYIAGRTRNLHYTDIRTQPWVFARHPHGRLWVDELASALGEGAIRPDLVRAEIGAGYARPSLAVELGLEGGVDPCDPEALEALDRAHGFAAQRELLERFAARKTALRARERDLAVARRPWLAPLHRLVFAVRERAARRRDARRRG